MCPEGLNPILRKCGRLNTLRLINCTGPFNDEMVKGLAGLDRSGLKELCLVWGSVMLSTMGFQCLVGSKRPTLEKLELVGCRYVASCNQGVLLLGMAL